MILADTSIWIEFFRRQSPVFNELKKQLEERNIVTTSWIFGELLQGAKKGEEEIIEAYWENLPHIGGNEIWIKAGKFSSTHQLMSKGIGLIDAAIIIAARSKNCQIWSLDKKLSSCLKQEEKFGF